MPYDPEKKRARYERWQAKRNPDWTPTGAREPEPVHGMTRGEVAAELGISRGRVAQIEASAMAKLEAQRELFATFVDWL